MKINVIALTNFLFFIIWGGFIVLTYITFMDNYFKILFSLIELYALMQVIFKWQRDAIKAA